MAGRESRLGRINRIAVVGKLDSLTDILKRCLFEYSPQSLKELIQEAQRRIPHQEMARLTKNVVRCLNRNPSFRDEGKGLWSLRLERVKENDAAHRLLQREGVALRIQELNERLREAGNEEVSGESQLVKDGRFLRLKDGRWGLIHWDFIEPQEGEKQPPAEDLPQETAKKELGRSGDLWEKVFPLQGKEEAAATGLELLPVTPAEGEGGEDGGSPDLLQELEALRRENQALLEDLEKLHLHREELRQQILQLEEQMLILRSERDNLKKRVSHLESRLVQLQGTLNKTVTDAQAEQARLKQMLKEQEYCLQTALIANEDLELTVAELQEERRELRKILSFWPVRLALRLSALLGLKPAGSASLYR